MIPPLKRGMFLVAALSALTGCASDREMGLCTTLGACNEKSDCEGDDCETGNTPTSAIVHRMPNAGGGSDDGN